VTRLCGAEEQSTTVTLLMVDVNSIRMLDDRSP
jgi:hypothetical protein